MTWTVSTVHTVLPPAGWQNLDVSLNGIQPRTNKNMMDMTITFMDMNLDIKHNDNNTSGDSNGTHSIGCFLKALTIYGMQIDLMLSIILPSPN